MARSNLVAYAIEWIRNEKVYYSAAIVLFDMIMHSHSTYAILEANVM